MFKAFFSVPSSLFDMLTSESVLEYILSLPEINIHNIITDYEYLYYICWNCNRFVAALHSRCLYVLTEGYYSKGQ